MRQEELSQRHLDGYRRCAICPHRRKRREFKPGLGLCEKHFKELPEDEQERLLNRATPPREKWEYRPASEAELIAANETGEN